MKSANTIQAVRNNRNANGESINLNESEGLRSNKLLAMIEKNCEEADTDDKPKDKRMAYIQSNAIASSFSASAKRLRIPPKCGERENSPCSSPSHKAIKQSLGSNLKMQFQVYNMRHQEQSVLETAKKQAYAQGNKSSKKLTDTAWREPAAKIPMKNRRIQNNFRRPQTKKQSKEK